MVRELFNNSMWNYRGDASRDFLRVCRNYVCDYNLNSFVVMEIQIDLVKLQSNFQKLGLDGYDFVEIRGYAGG